MTKGRMTQREAVIIAAILGLAVLILLLAACHPFSWGKESEVAVTEGAVSGTAVSSGAVSGSTLSGEAVSGGAVSGSAVSGKAVSATGSSVSDDETDETFEP
jgi:uncharacterized membrane protein